MIRLQFAAANDLGSIAIRAFEQGAGYSHVDAVMPDGSLLGARHDCVGGKPAGVQIRCAAYKAFSKTLVVDLPTSEAVSEQFYALLLDEIGKPYDSRAIEAFIFDRDWRDPGAWFCSELIAAKLEACGWFPFPLATPANKLTPDGLLLAISARVRVAC